MTAPAPMARLNGIAVCGGSRIGPALLFEESPDVVALPDAPAQDARTEKERLRRAVGTARDELERLQAQLGGEAGVGGIFRAHGLLLDSVVPGIEAAIDQGQAAERAVAGVLHAASARLAASANRLMAQRAQDLVDVERRLLRALTGASAPAGAGPAGGDRPVVIVARDLTPSETAALEGRAVAAIALEEGGVTSHSAVIARSLGIPCVVGVAGLLARVQHGEPLWVEGTQGFVVVQPDEASRREALGLAERYDRFERSLLAESQLPCETLDGHKVTLLANIEFPPDVDAGLARGAEGVGLYRTEFLVRPGAAPPGEEQHLAAYRGTLQRLAGGRLTVRTFDFGSDKEAPLGGPREPNPALGVRSLRWCFAHPQAFHVQLRALLRGAAEGDVRILLPMVAGLDDLRRARALIAAAAAELLEQGLPCRPDVPVGIMVEIPAAAVTSDLLVREADFLSIGTNDLIQYDLAVDRLNPRLAPLFQPSHPSILRLLRDTLAAAARAGVPVTLCGERGGHALHTALLLGLGLREFSVSPGTLPRVRRLLRSLTVDRARRIARECLELSTAAEVEAHLRRNVPPLEPAEGPLR
ncbi:MAG: phosphoenolpyruvate--protein phosphotransferase [Planctomycetia bacterium]